MGMKTHKELTDFVELNYYLGPKELMEQMNISRDMLYFYASPRVREYWDLMDATSAHDKLIKEFEALCSKLYMTPKSAVNILKKYYKK